MPEEHVSFDSNEDVDSFGWSYLTSFVGATRYFVCRVTGIGSSQRIEIDLSADSAPGDVWDLGSTAGHVVADDQVASLRLEPGEGQTSPYIFVVGARPSSGFSACFTDYHVECKLSTDSTW